MALKPLRPGLNPLGQFDGLDSDVLTMKGGEVVSFCAVTTESQPGVSGSGLDAAAFDVFDGYVNESGTLKRPAVTRLWDGTHLPADGVTPLSTASGRPLMLSDDGIAGYGTLFGTVVGGTVGQVSFGPASTVPSVDLLGPHTATGSGKVTCWDKPGLYAVSLDATDGYLQPSNTALIVGKPLSFTSTGLLTPVSNAGGTDVSGHPIVGYFVEFNTNQSLVTTPNFLVAALNSPSGNVSSAQPRAFQFTTIYWNPALAE